MIHSVLVGGTLDPNIFPADLWQLCVSLPFFPRKKNNKKSHIYFARKLSPKAGVTEMILSISRQTWQGVKLSIWGINI